MATLSADFMKLPPLFLLPPGALCTNQFPSCSYKCCKSPGVCQLAHAPPLGADSTTDWEILLPPSPTWCIYGVKRTIAFVVNKITLVEGKFSGSVVWSPRNPKPPYGPLPFRIYLPAEVLTPEGPALNLAQ